MANERSGTSPSTNSITMKITLDGDPHARIANEGPSAFSQTRLSAGETWREWGGARRYGMGCREAGSVMVGWVELEWLKKSTCCAAVKC